MPVLRMGFHVGTGFSSKLIQWQTRSIYSHCSLIIDDVLVEALYGKGVIDKRNIHRVMRDERVDVGELKVPDLATGLSFAMLQVGKHYNRFDVVRFVTRDQRKRQHEGYWFCGELNFATTVKCGLPALSRVEPWKVSPGLLAMSPLITFPAT